MTGLSPRARGIREICVHQRNSHGSIPACAGNTACATNAKTCPRVYPRVRGEYSQVVAADARIPVYPRVRGEYSFVLPSSST